MRVLLRAGVANFSAWGIEFLVKQLSDTDSKASFPRRTRRTHAET